MIQGRLVIVILAGIMTAAALASGVRAAGVPVKPVDAAAKSAKVSRVLYLNSYDRSYEWSDDIERGLTEGLKNAVCEIELSIEYLDGRRFPETARNGLLAATLAAKYGGYRHDVVVVSDNFAFDFAIQYRRLLFPDLPIVFCGYNNFRPDVLKEIGNITGVNEEVDFSKTVELAIQVQPTVHNLVFITSTDDASSRRMSEVVQTTLFPELRKGYNLIVLKDAPMDEIRTRLGALPPESAVFLIGISSDLIEGRRSTPIENARMILAVSPVPVYSFWDFHLGTGILGGHIITGLDQGQAAADMVLRILGGTPADDIAVMTQTPGRNIIDFNVMKRYNIKLSALPEGCSFINRPESLWESYGWYLGAAVLAIALESFLIIILVLSLRHRKEALEALRESEEKYRLITDNSNDWIYLINPEGEFQYVSPSSERITGYSCGEFINSPQLFLNLIHPEDKERVEAHCETVHQETESGYLEFRITTKQGKNRWIMHSCLPIYNDQDQYMGRSATNRDFTERKLAEDTQRLLASRLLTSQEEEQRRIAMELHDQTGQDILFLKIQLQSLRDRLRKDQNNLKEECDKILTLTNRIIEDVRRMAHGLNPSELQTLGLSTALKALIRNFSEKTRISVHHNVEALENGFRPETQIVLYRIFPEALTNICKHAQAKTVRIAVYHQDDDLTISIMDDGQGFDACRYPLNEPTIEQGMGLSALELRARMIGADLKISSQPGLGTQINLCVPIGSNRIG
jgi:PAS domain S-box-containing protein